MANISTKEQERKALERIKKIVADLGPDSYVATAFEGCFEIAADNIENDFACSMKQRAEAAEKKVSTLELDNRDLRDSIKRIKDEASKKETSLQKHIKHLEALFIGKDDRETILALIKDAERVACAETKKAAEEIVRLADHPDCSAFVRAVSEHRDAHSRANRLLMLKARIQDTITYAGA